MFVFPFFEKFCLFPYFSPRGMETAARFSALARRDLPFVEYAWEFCGLAAKTAWDDATINSLFWTGANYHHPVDLPDTKGLCWREGILQCLESVLPRSRTSPPSIQSAVPQSNLSVVPQSSPPSAANSSLLSAADLSPPAATDIDFIYRFKFNN